MLALGKYLPVVVRFLAPEVGSLCGGAPQHVVVLLKVAGKKQVAAKHGDVLGEVPKGDVKVSALLCHGLTKIYIKIRDTCTKGHRIV